MFRITTLPDIPVQIDPLDLKDQFKLLSAEQITAIKNAQLEERRYTKAELKNKGIDSNYHIIRKGDNYFAVYYGVSKGKHIHFNAESKRSVKYMQNIDTGEWDIIKTEKLNAYNGSRS